MRDRGWGAGAAGAPFDTEFDDHWRVERRLVDSAYNERRQQCEAAAAALGVPALRDADKAMLEAAAARLDPMALRRTRYLVTENAWLTALIAALAGNDLTTAGVP